MLWPTLCKQDVFSLCDPFSFHSTVPGNKGFRGVVYFDVGSVLLDLDWEGFFKELMGYFSVEHEFSLEKFKATWVQKNVNHFWSIGSMSSNEFVQAINDLFQQSCLKIKPIPTKSYTLKLIDAHIIGQLRPKVLEIVRKLRKNNFLVGLLSNTTPWHVSLIYEKLQVTENFDVYIFSNDVGFEKPAEGIYDCAFQEASKLVSLKYKIDLKKDNIYFLDDTPANVKSALNLGWNARLVNLIKDDILVKLKHNEISDSEFQIASQKRENLLFGEEASQRIEFLFGKIFS